MNLIIGLGNPGSKYERTRHNVGFLAIDEFSKENNFPDWKKNKNFNFSYSKKEINSKKEIELIKPLSFMNNAGQTIKDIFKNRNLKPDDIIVIHDDMDLPLGRIKIVKNRGSAGHKGVDSIIKELKTKDFTRIRIGICPKIGKPKNPEKFVLQKFTENEKEFLKRVIKKTALAVKTVINRGLKEAMNQYNK